MQYLIINLFIIFVSVFYLRRLQIKELSSMNAQIDTLDHSYNNIIMERKNIQEKVIKLEKVLNDTVALYEVTKETCKTLVEQEVSVIFKERLLRFLDFEDCICVSDKNLPGDKQGYKLFPLITEGQTLGYLAIKNLKKEAPDILSILINQFAMCLKRIRLYQKLQELAITDSLTGIFSRRYCLERLREEIVRSLEFELKFSILMIDIDHFKRYNDHFGHLVGDAILRELSNIIKNNIRSIDLLGRFGGEEFIVILPQTSKDAAKITAERIRGAARDAAIKAYDETLRVTISIGCASFSDDSKEMLELIDKADFALYRAKKTGRNRICLYGVYE